MATSREILNGRVKRMKRERRDDQCREREREKRDEIDGRRKDARWNDREWKIDG